MSADLPTFTHREFANEKRKRDRVAAQHRLAQLEMKALFTRAKAQTAAAFYLLAYTRPVLFVVHEGRNYARRATPLDLIRNLFRGA